MGKYCKTSGKLSYNRRGEAYTDSKNKYNNCSVYECACGCYHLTKKKRKKR